MHNKEREAAKAGPQLPASQESHDEAFKHALANTIKYKAAISSGEAAREAIDSLLKAGQVSLAMDYRTFDFLSYAYKLLFCQHPSYLGVREYR